MTVRGDNQLAVVPKRNFICNFRAPSEEQFLEWKSYVAWCQDHGRDVCYMTLSLASAFMVGVNGSAQIRDPSQTINLQMNNTFTYQVQKPRREPYDLSCIKKEYRKTFSSILFEAYVKDKARTFNREFCFRDFLEMDDRAFHRIVRRLIRKGEIMANPRRSVPRYYFLTEKLGEYGFKKI